MAQPPLRLTRLPSQEPRWEFTQRAWQKAMEAIEESFAGLAASVAAIEAAQAAADAANLAAAAANTAAATAQTAAETVEASSALANSYTTGLTITATDAGTSATITISAHTRVYGDGSSVSVMGGSLTGLAYSSSFWVGYVDAARTGGAVTYTSSASIQGNGTSADYHFVGAVTTPAALGGPEPGVPVLPPGANIP
jgi:hypothetical protein